MDSIFRGELVTSIEFIKRIDELRGIIESDLLIEPLLPEIVIEAVGNLINNLNYEIKLTDLLNLGIPKWAAEDYLQTLIRSLNKEQLMYRVGNELGKNPFMWKSTEEVSNKLYPLGVLMHIGASNTLGLSAYSVLEGLLTGNINILKLPEHEGGITVDILMELIKIEPRLKPFIYVINVSSNNQIVINNLIGIVNSIVVWGSDETVRAIRKMTPPTISIIEWGHKLSFAYFTKNERLIFDLENLAKEIVLTDQLYCSSPQCVFYETDDKVELDLFADKLAAYLDENCKSFPSKDRQFNVESQITWKKELIKMEEVLGKKRLLTNKDNDFSVMIDYQTTLKPAPLFRNIWVMPIRRTQILSLLREHKGHLQTVGLSCVEDELEHLSHLFYRAGVTRILPVGKMSTNFIGEPHDGSYSLQRYVRIVTRKNNIN